MRAKQKQRGILRTAQHFPLIKFADTRSNKKSALVQAHKRNPDSSRFGHHSQGDLVSTPDGYFSSINKPLSQTLSFGFVATRGLDIR